MIANKWSRQKFQAVQRLRDKCSQPVSKYAKCTECGLKIRCGDKSRHDAGWHHMARS